MQAFMEMATSSGICTAAELTVMMRLIMIMMVITSIIIIMMMSRVLLMNIYCRFHSTFQTKTLFSTEHYEH